MDRQTDWHRQTLEKQYAPDLSMRGHKNIQLAIKREEKTPTVCLFSISNFFAPFSILCPMVPATQYPGIITCNNKITRYT